MKSKKSRKSTKTTTSKSATILSCMVLTVCLMTGCGSNSDSAQNSGGNTTNTADNVTNNTSTTGNQGTPDTMVSANAAETQPVNAGENITEEEAESIALEAAGFTAESVTGLRTEYEVDDGVPKYEVQFYHENTEYDYNIHAQTGEILSYDVDTPND